MSNANPDLSALRAMLADFERYIISDEIFWELSERGPASNRYPKLTLGGLLLIVQRLGGQADPEIQAALTEQKVLFGRWRSNVERKALREIKTRLTAWNHFLHDCQENPSQCHDYYPTEVLARTYLTLLLNQVETLKDAEDYRRAVAAADNALRNEFKAGPFVWDAALAPQFNATQFWYLYGRPRQH